MASSIAYRSGCVRSRPVTWQYSALLLPLRALAMM